MTDRTLMRPRDLLTFLQRAIEVAVNRGHAEVSADDIRQAEQSFSEDMLLMLDFEMQDTRPEFANKNIVYAFQGSDAVVPKRFVEETLYAAGISDDEIPEAIELLLWFGFLGVTDARGGDDRYSYQVRYNLRHLLHSVQTGEGQFVIHPAFREALDVREAAAVA